MKLLIVGLSGLAVLAGFFVLEFNSNRDSDAILKKLPVGCSGIFQTSSTVNLNCKMEDSAVSKVSFSGPNNHDLTASVTCGMTVLGSSDERSAPHVNVDLLDKSGKLLGTGMIADFNAAELTKSDAKAIQDEISIDKGSDPKYFVVRQGLSSKLYTKGSQH